MNEKTNDQLLRMANIRLRYIDSLLDVDEQDDELRANCKAETNSTNDGLDSAKGATRLTDDEIMAGMPIPTEMDNLLVYIEELDDLIKYCGEIKGENISVDWDRVRYHHNNSTRFTKRGNQMRCKKCATAMVELPEVIGAIIWLCKRCGHKYKLVGEWD